MTAKRPNRRLRFDDSKKLRGNGGDEGSGDSDEESGKSGEDATPSPLKRAERRAPPSPENAGARGSGVASPARRGASSKTKTTPTSKRRAKKPSPPSQEEDEAEDASPVPDDSGADAVHDNKSAATPKRGEKRSPPPLQEEERPEKRAAAGPDADTVAAKPPKRKKKKSKRAVQKDRLKKKKKKQIRKAAEAGAASAAESKERFINTYNRLKELAAESKERLIYTYTPGHYLPVPEIVVIGGKSDGKSSLLEALLGFRFNTRRPLELHMVNDSTAINPRFRFQDEDSLQYGEPIDYDATKIANIIRNRTESHLVKIQAAVSSTPIVAKVEYAHCSDLIVIDTPGLVLEPKRGEPETTPAQIKEMVVAQASQPHRMILFVQQSSLAWCSCPWRRILKTIDPSFQRTVFVISKFDNRLKEFKVGLQVNHYLSAQGAPDDLNSNALRFFVALPVDDDGTISNGEFQKKIYELDAEVLVMLRKLGFDEHKYGSNIGISCLHKYLVSELLKRYKEAARDIQLVLEQKCTALSEDLARLDSRLKTNATASWFRKASMQHITNIWKHLIEILDGDPALQIWGATTEEERIASGIVSWPGIEQPVKPPNSGLRLYGAAAFARVMAEFRCAAGLMECPHVSQGKVDGMLHGHAGRNWLNKPAAEIAREAARSCLAPLIDTACKRLAFVLRSLFDLAVQRNHNQNKDSQYHHNFEDMNNYITFGAAFRYAYYEFIKEVSNQFKQEACYQLDLVTSYISSGVGADDMCSKSGSAYSSKCKICGQYFGKMINAVIERTETSAGSGFLTPWRKGLYAELCIKLSAMSDDKFMEMFPEGAVNNLLNKKNSLLERQRIFQAYVDEFKNIPWDL